MSVTAPYIMHIRFALGQKVRFNKRCVLSNRVPQNNKGYTHAILVPEAGDEYQGAGSVPVGTVARVVDYAVHGTASSEDPIVDVNGIRARCHRTHLESV